MAKGSQHNIPKADSFGENRKVIGKSSENTEEKRSKIKYTCERGGRCPHTDWVH